jgi:phospholipase D1/2
VKNVVAQTIVDRIKKAARQGEKFRVVIIIPLLPGFPGEFTESSSPAVVKCGLYWQY